MKNKKFFNLFLSSAALVTFASTELAVEAEEAKQDPSVETNDENTLSLENNDSAVEVAEGQENETEESEAPVETEEAAEVPVVEGVEVQEETQQGQEAPVLAPVQEEENNKQTQVEQVVSTASAEENTVETPVAETAEAELAEESVEEAYVPKTMVSFAGQADVNQVNRVSGKDRYVNAMEMAQEGWDQANRVYIASGEIHTDALSGTPLAALEKAPLLLTRGDDVPKEVIDGIKGLGAKEVVILGGTPTISENVEKQLQQTGAKVSRIAGRDRYDQANKVAKKVIQAQNGEVAEAFIVSGEAFADGISIAPYAAQKNSPIFFTRANQLDQSIIDAIPVVKQFTIVGGTPTIEASVENQLRQLGGNVRRISGKNRYELNRNVIKQYGSDVNHYYIASGEHFSDAIPASALAARKGSGLLLVKNENLQTLKEQSQFAASQGVTNFTILGGTPTLSNGTADYLKNPVKKHEQVLAVREAERKAKEEAAKKAAEEAARKAAAEQAARKAAEEKKRKEEEAKRVAYANSQQNFGQNVVNIANRYYGSPYAWGGTTPAGFDCSGFSQYVYRQAGKSIPRTATQQYHATQRVSNPQIGDLVFFAHDGYNISHVGIYTGNNTMISAENPRTGVNRTNLGYDYWARTFVGYGRVK